MSKRHEGGRLGICLRRLWGRCPVPGPCQLPACLLLGYWSPGGATTGVFSCQSIPDGDVGAASSFYPLPEGSCEFPSVLILLRQAPDWAAWPFLEALAACSGSISTGKAARGKA